MKKIALLILLIGLTGCDVVWPYGSIIREEKVIGKELSRIAVVMEEMNKKQADIDEIKKHQDDLYNAYKILDAKIEELLKAYKTLDYQTDVLTQSIQQKS